MRSKKTIKFYSVTEDELLKQDSKTVYKYNYKIAI